MKQYRVISPFVERDETGQPTGRRFQKDEVVNLSEKEAERLTKARCVVEVEIQMKSAPENRMVKRGRRNA